MNENTNPRPIENQEPPASTTGAAESPSRVTPEHSRELVDPDENLIPALEQGAEDAALTYQDVADFERLHFLEKLKMMCSEIRGEAHQQCRKDHIINLANELEDLLNGVFFSESL